MFADCIVTFSLIQYMFLWSDESHFGLYAAGEVVNINCNDGSGLADQVQWLNSSTEEVLSVNGSTSVLLTFYPITDAYHSLQYICRIHTSGTVRDLTFIVFVLGKEH